MRQRATRLFSMANPNGIGGPVPTLDLDFLSMGTLDPRITYTRTGNASVIDSSGAMTIVGPNVPRLDYDPVTLQPLGCLSELAVSNLLANRATMATESVTVTNVRHTLSFYGTGTVVLSGAHSATVVGTGAYPTRTTLVFTPTAGTLTLTVTGTCLWANLEIGGRATSWIPDASRSADVANMTGTNFSSWYNQPEGTFVAEVELLQPIANSTGQLRAMATTSGGAGGRVADMFYIPGRWLNFNGSTTMEIIVSQPSINKVALAYKSGSYALTANGATPVTASTDTVNSPNQLNIGHLALANQLNGRIRRIRYYPTRLSNADLQSLTAP